MERRLAAIVLADIVGYSHLMGDDEAGTLTAVAALRSSIIDPAVEARGGRLVKAMGDGFLRNLPALSMPSNVRSKFRAVLRNEW